MGKRGRWVGAVIAVGMVAAGAAAPPAAAASATVPSAVAARQPVGPAATVSAADVGGAGTADLAVPNLPVRPAVTAQGLPAGTVLPYGAAPNEGSLAGKVLNQPIVGMAATPDGNGYWLVAADGGIFNFGDARFYGSTGGIHLNRPIVGMAAAPNGEGYWLVAADGGIFNFGPGAHFYGSTGSIHLNQPIVGMAAAPSATPSGGGYWLAAADGGIFNFGPGAHFYGSTGSIHLNRPIVGTAAAPNGEGYWLVAADGGIFNFGPGGHFYGSTGSIHLNQPIVGMAAAPKGEGYWLAAADGGIFNFGPGAHFYGSAAAHPLAQPVVGITASPLGTGYWLVQGQRTPPPAPAAQVFTPGVIAALNSRAGVVSASVLDLNNGEMFQYRPGQGGITASIVKVQILGTLLAEAQAQGRGLTANEQGLATAMIEYSDNNAATALWNEDGGAPAVAAFDRSAGLTATYPAPAWGLTVTTATDQVTLLRHLVQPNPILDDPSRNYELTLMEHVTPSEAWGVSSGVPAGVTVALKNGWLPTSNGWTVNSVGWVDGSGRNYLIAVLTDVDPSEGYGIDSIGIVSQAAWNALG